MSILLALVLLWPIPMQQRPPVTHTLEWELPNDPILSEIYRPPSIGLPEREPSRFTPQPQKATPEPLKPSQTTTTAPKPETLTGGVEQWRGMVAHFSGWDVDRMLRIMACESGGVPNITNRQGSGAAGLFQIMPFWQSVWPGDYFDPWINAAVAYQIWLQQGYGAWVCRG